MIKGRKIRGIIVAIALIICTAVSVVADSSKGWNIEHKRMDANFYGNVSFSVRNGLFKSVITYYGHIGGADKGLSRLSVDSNYNFFRAPNDEVGTLMISTKNHYDGNLVKDYAASNHQINTEQHKDYVKKINVNLEFGTKYNHIDDKFTLD